MVAVMTNRERAEILSDLTAIVRYRRADWSHGWITMAAFDQMSIAESYAKECTGDGTRPWVYEALEIGEPSS